MKIVNILMAASMALVTGSMAANIALVRQNAILRTKVSSFSNELKISLDGPLQVPMSGTALSGAPFAVDFRKADDATGWHQARILFVLSPECRFCAANWVNWHKLLKDRDAAPRWQPVFVNIGPPLDTDYVERHELGKFTIFQSVSPQSAVAYKLFSTPQTIVIDTSGRARGAWGGTLGPKQMEAIRRLVLDPGVVGTMAPKT